MRHPTVSFGAGGRLACGIALVLTGCTGDGDSRFDGVDGRTPTDTTDPVPDTGDGRPDTTAPNTSTSGGAERCVILYGGNDRIRGADEGLPVGDEPRTLQAWVRTGSDREQIAVSHGRPSANQGFQLGTSDGLPMARTGSGNDMLVGDIEVADDAWHHLAAAFDGRLVVLMVDGEVAGSGELVTDTIQGDVVAGNTPTGDLSKPWIGWLDDVRIFRGARTPADVDSDLDGVDVEPQHLELWWDFEISGDSGPGVAVDDLSGNGHDGTTGGTDGSPAFVSCR